MSDVVVKKVCAVRLGGEEDGDFEPRYEIPEGYRLESATPEPKQSPFGLPWMTLVFVPLDSPAPTLGDMP